MAFFSGGQRRGLEKPSPLHLDKFIPAMRITLKPLIHPTVRARTRHLPTSDNACDRLWQAGCAWTRLI